MKLKFHNFLGDDVKSLASFDLPKKVGDSSPRLLHFERGVALIITLILMSVTLVMALAFLAISNRERASVTTTTDTANARLASDAALSVAEAQIVANALEGGSNAAGNATANPYNFGLLVSTNFINYAGFDSTATSLNPTNVNYDHLLHGGAALSQNQFLQNLADLEFLPRPPVFIPTNGNTVGNDFRFYLDLNRNGQYDTNGWVTNVNNNLQGLGTTSFEAGDPEWIGLLQHPDQPYGPNNKFIARFAFAAMPVGNALDLNYIYNEVLEENNADPTVNPAGNSGANAGKDFFFRNQGIGTWEMNLAAFLADLNTNEWDSIGSGGIYSYNQATPLPVGPSPNTGAAFDDARALLAYRYNNSYASLARVNNLFGGPPLGAGYNTFIGDSIDGYSDGPLQSTFNTNEDFFAVADTPSLPWAGADNTNHFYDLTSDLFDTSKTAIGAPANNNFTFRLLDSTTNSFGGKAVSTYDHYTFYRLLSQMGTESQVEPPKMNLNYDNLDTNGVVVPGKETNFISWTATDQFGVPTNALKFFTNAADRMLKAYTAEWATNYAFDDDGASPFFNTFTNSPSLDFIATFNGETNLPSVVTNSFGVGDIPVYVKNHFVYTPAVNRLLQLAANMYDATSTNYYPTIFRPLFSRDQNGFGTNLFITGFALLTNGDANRFVEGQELSEPDLAMPIEMSTLAYTNNTYLVSNMLVNVYGVPWIVGAKKGIPNFNEFAVANSFGLTRKLQFVRDTNALVQPAITETNQMYLMALTNYYGIEMWNSYRSNYLGYGTDPTAQGALDIFTRCNSYMLLTNDDNFYKNQGLPGFPITFGFTNLYHFPNSQFSSWPGWNGANNSSSLVLPLNSSVTWFTNVVAYWYNGFRPNNSSSFTYNTNYPDAGTAAIQNLPDFKWLTTNRLQVAVIDFSGGQNNGRVIDYVQLGGMDDVFNPNSLLNENDDADDNNCWSTNTYNPGSTTNLGVFHQIEISEGTKGSPTGDEGWTSARIPGGPADNTSKEAQAAFFRAFFSKDGVYQYLGNFYTNKETSVQAPYTPSIAGYESISWQANDPLVHYLKSDLTAGAPNNSTTVTWPNTKPDNLGLVNTRFLPWGSGFAAQAGFDSDPNNLAFKDPLVRLSDNWDFPTNKFPSIGWLGRVHRGTPWQTVYLKAKDILPEAQVIGATTNYIGTNTWVKWTGDNALANGDYFDAANAAPTQDRMLFDLFTTALDDNATRGRLSVNVGAADVGNSLAGLAAWSAVFSGVTVLSNNLPDVVAASVGHFQGQTAVPKVGTTPGYYLPSYIYTNIQPAGPLGASSQLGQIVAGINRTRSTFTNGDGLVGAFERTGDILATPELTDIFPYLKTWTNYTQNGQPVLVEDGAQVTNGISDEMYEWLPQQVMGLLRVGDAPRYVIYCYGQTLKPAPNGIFTGTTSIKDANGNSASAFGMITNYQITAESATRVVVRIDGLVNSVTGRPLPPSQQHPHAVIESFSTLPPD